MGRNNQNDRQRQLMSILPRYALRKTKLGCVSMLIAVGFFLGGANELNVKADTLPTQNGKTATIQSKAPSADYESLAAAADSFTASVNEKSDHPAKASSLTATTSAASVAANVAADNSDSKVSCDALGSVQAEASTDDSAVVYQNSSALVSSSARGQAGAAISNSADSAQDPSMVMASAAQKVSEPPVVQSNATEPSLINTTGAVINDPSLPAEDVTVDAKNFNHYFDMHGTATDQLNSDGSVTITFTKKGQQYSAGGISLKEKINMDSSFTLNGQINLGNFGGADGMGIVFHTGSVDALGRPGGNLGIAGLPDAVGFKLDSYYDYYNEPTSSLPGDQIPLPQNGEDDSKYGQSQDPTMAVPCGDIVTTSHEQVTTTTGKKAWRWWVNNQDGTVQPLTTSLMDGRFHDFQMQYNGQTHVLTIRLKEPAGHLNDSVQTHEDEQWVTWTYQIPDIPGNGNVAMALDLAATTGELTNLQQFRLTSFTFSPAASVNVEYLNEQGQLIHQTGVHYSGAPVIGNTYSTDQLNLPGYTYIGLGKGSLAPSGTLRKEGLNGTVIYVYGRTEKITVNYQDVSADDPQNLSGYDQELTGARNQSSDYSTAKIIKELEAKGYQLVNDPTGGKVLKYGDGAQSYTVKLEHRHLIIGPSHYQDNGIPLPDNPAKTYQGVERNDLNQQATRTIKYEFANGQPAAAAVSQPVAYTRSADIDEVTGDVVYTPWTAAPAKYPSIASPTIPGHFTNTPSVAAASPTLGQNPVVTVIYQPCTEKIRIVYEDVSTKDPQSLSQYDKLLLGKYGSSADYSTADTIKALERQGYQLVSDPTDGQVLSFNNTSERTYVIKLKRQSANTDHHAGGSVKPPTSKPTDPQGKGTAPTAAGVKTDDHQIKQQSSWQPIDGQADQSGKAHHVAIADSTSSAIQLTKSNNYDAVSAPNETASVKHLPQTGNRHADLLTGLGLLLAGIGGWLGFDEVRRRFKRVLK